LALSGSQKEAGMLKKEYLSKNFSNADCSLQK
jgi:hypothetical protein